jgi:hypothetical protein
MGKSVVRVIAELAVAFVSAACAFALLLFAGAKLFSNRPGLHMLLVLTPLISLGIAGLVFTVVFLKLRSKQSSQRF